MTHREKSLTGHIVNDPNGTMSQLRAAFERMFEVHEDRDPPLGTEANPIIIPQSLYNRAKAEGCIMRGYAVPKTIPSHGEIMEHKTPNSAEMRASIARKLAAGEPLGAFHDHLPGKFEHVGCLTGGYPEYSKSIDAARWNDCKGARWGDCKGATKQSDSVPVVVAPATYSLDHGKTWHSGKEFLEQLRKSGVRKRISERSCPDDGCMMGLRGKCTACAGDN